MTTTNKAPARKRAPKSDPLAERNAALLAAPNLEAMARILDVSPKGTFRPFVRAKIGHVSREGIGIVRTPEALALINERFPLA